MATLRGACVVQVLAEKPFIYLAWLRLFPYFTSLL